MSKKVASIFDNKDDDDHSEHHHQQAFFAGGSETSGQQILGPERGANLIENLLNDARQHAELNPAPTNETLQVTFWRNGFTIGEDGELRDYESNREFLTYLRRGEVPPELAARVRGGLVDVKLDNRAFQDYEPSKEKRPVFKGEGFRLGVPTPAVVSDGSSTSATTNQATESSKPSLDEIRQARLARFGQKPKQQPEK
uniref:NSFL1 cofactor p47 n=1 Tax=Aceria tosichella TaxID=561515 RepID=A0A6G1S3J1_9ACAR